MPRWIPTEEWKDQDVFIIGGGPSLTNFQWSLLLKEYTIGCNSAFIHGPDVCNICIFGDPIWFLSFSSELEDYTKIGGVVVTNANRHKLPKKEYSWLWTMERKMTGLSKDPKALGWNGNTGASAINLALLLGVKRIYLLGFDMKRIDNKSNWHTRIIRPAATKPQIYQMFAHQFQRVFRDWKKKFSDCEIFNVTKDSGLKDKLFPWIDPEKFWKERRKVM